MAAKILILNDVSDLNEKGVKGLLDLARSAENVDHLKLIKEGLAQAGVTYDETEGKLTFDQQGERVTFRFGQDGQIRGFNVEETPSPKAPELSSYVPDDPIPQA